MGVAAPSRIARAARPGAAFAACLCRARSLGGRWLVVTLAGIWLVAASMMSEGRFSDPNRAVLHFSVPFAGFAKRPFPGAATFTGARVAGASREGGQ